MGRLLSSIKLFQDDEDLIKKLLNDFDVQDASRAAR
jgi:hypothetical protein